MKSALKAMTRAIGNLLSRAVVTGVNTAKKCQAVQVELMPGEPKEDVEHLEPYGFTSAPLTGAEAIAVFPDGDRSHGVVLVVADRRYRIKGLAAGEVALYTDEGDTLIFRRGNIVELKTKTLNIDASDAVNIKTKNFTLDAAVAAAIKTRAFTLDASTTVAITTASYSATAMYSASTTAPQIALNGNLTVNDPSGGAAGNAVLRGHLKIIGSQETTQTSTALDHLSAGHSGALHSHGGVEPGNGNSGGPQ